MHHHKKNYYQPGTRIDLRKDEYSLLVTISNFTYSKLLPLVGLVAICDWLLRANGL